MQCRMYVGEFVCICAKKIFIHGNEREVLHMIHSISHAELNANWFSYVHRSLRISTPLSDSACSSSTESSDGESASNYPLEPYGGEPIEILPGLFLGNAAHSEDITKIQKYNIRYILNVSTLPNVFEDTGKIEYLKIAITDHWSQDLSVHFPSAIKFIEDAKAKNVSCLVHCLAGVSRVNI